MRCAPRSALQGSLVVLIAAALGACGGDDDFPAGPDLGACSAEVDMFPTPVNSSTSPFDSIDDDYLFVAFHPSFDFTFYGNTYDGVYLNTNGGMTFFGGDWDYDVAATDVTLATIAVFWGDLDAGDQGADTRANQMKYQACAEGFVVRYNRLQDNDWDIWDNTATVTLESNGKITVQYGTVGSQDILVGIFNGGHVFDQRVAVQNSYTGYSAPGNTGLILFDAWGPGPSHTGQLNNRTITYNP